MTTTLQPLDSPQPRGCSLANHRPSRSSGARSISSPCLAALLAGCWSTAAVAESAADAPTAPPAGNGQMVSPLEFFKDPNPPADDPDRGFSAQRSPDGKIVLTASNGFFDRGIRALGESEVKDAAPKIKDLIREDFGYLARWNTPGHSLRWHFWIENPGQLWINSHLVVGKENAGARLSYSLAGTSHELVTRAESDAAIAQGEALGFEIGSPGWHTLTIKLEKSAGKAVGEVHRLEVFGPAVEGASLLRARFRPPACHATFTSSKVEDPVAWVISTRSLPGITSYSPVTTPFGYYGCSFNDLGKSGGHANFTLWSYGSKGEPAPQEKWSHMLAVGSPKATFGSFGHEGSGVKLRGDWDPFKGFNEVTLALRYEAVGPWVRWFGYFLDPATNRFRFYAAAAKMQGKDKSEDDEVNPSELRRFKAPGAFVEQPGGAKGRRCGDQVRDVHRRGWMLDKSNQWHALDTMSTGKAEAAPKHWGKTKDGWFSMGMGGIAQRPGPKEKIRIKPGPLPAWLNEQALEDLQRLPAKIGPRSFTDIDSNSATVRIPLAELETGESKPPTVKVFYGPEDCMTFEKDLGYRNATTRFWQKSTTPVTVEMPETSIELTELDPNTTYFIRILVETPQGSIWSFETDTFQTLPGE